MSALIDRASGRPPEEVIQVFTDVVRDAFRPSATVWIAPGDPGWERVPPAFAGRHGTVALWDVPQAHALRPDLYVALPLERRGEIAGVLFLGEPTRGRPYGRQSFSVLSALLKEAGVLYDNAALFEDNLRHLRHGLEREKARRVEREALLRDLHDGLGGLATRIVLLAAPPRVADPSSAAHTLATVAELARESVAEVRRFMSVLDSPAPSWETLIAELRFEGGRATEAHGLSFDLQDSVDPAAPPPGAPLALNLHRVLKEALTNVVKHAVARSVGVVVRVSPDRVTLTVRDDGAGIAEGAQRGRGIAGMRGRAESAGGRLEVVRDGGTVVFLEAPVAARPEGAAETA